MSYEKLIRIPTDRIGALIGKSGNTKKLIEKKCSVSLDIDSEGGEVMITTKKLTEDIEPFKAVEIVSAIGRGFSPENAMRLLSCLLYTSPSPRDGLLSRMPSSA